MAVTAEEARVYIGAAADEIDAVTADLAEAVAEIDGRLAEAWRPCPEPTRDRMVREVAHELFKRRDSPTGASQYADFGTGQPVSGPRDPLTRVWPTLRRYVSPF